MIGLGSFSFYKGSSDNYVEHFNINYEKIKMIILLFCFITLIITFYSVNPGGSATQYFGYSLLLTIIITVFAFLYLIIVMTLSGKEGTSSKNTLSNFSSGSKYGSIFFIIFVVLMSIFIAYNKTAFFENKAKSTSVIILMLIICILWVVLLGANWFIGGAKTITFGDTNKIELFKKSLLVLFGLVISGLLIFWITFNIEGLSGNSSIFRFSLNLLMVAVILGLIYKTINVNLPSNSGNTQKNTFINLILNTFLYIPCLVSGIFDWVSKQINGTEESGSWMMLFLAVGLIIAYFKTPNVFNLISSQGGTPLINQPVNTDTTYNLGSYIDLNGGSDTFDYQYAISCWVFLEALSPSTTINSNKFTSLLNFGNKPNILYESKTNTLMITMEQTDLKNITKNKLTDFDEKGNRIIYTNSNILLQKWNNIIVNYNGGTLDIFLNGELVKSSDGVVPYHTLDNLTVGESNGVKGGICNVVYFRQALTSQNIYYIYNTVKERTPPLLNNTNETILVNNLEQSSNSINT